MFRLVLPALLLLGSLLRADEVALIRIGDSWRYFKGTMEASSPASAWREIGFDDSSWFSSPSGFSVGFGGCSEWKIVHRRPSASAAWILSDNPVIRSLCRGRRGPARDVEIAVGVRRKTYRNLITRGEELIVIHGGPGIPAVGAFANHPVANRSSFVG